MTWMDVVGGTPPPAFPGGHGYGEYYALTASPPAAPSGLTAVAASSATIDLAWVDNSVDDTGFSIERSGDGVNFAFLATVGANVVTYADNGLTADTTYWYRVNAENAAGASAWSNTASATTPPATGATAVEVGSIVVTTVGAGKGLKHGRATVVVVDDLGAPVAGATVIGDFSGTFDEPGVTGPLTDADGTTVVDTSGSQKGGVALTFCVTSISHPALADWTGRVCASN